ncbi:6978_t:CDS:1 [Paraglomus occultum]|uniref:6978_t:CDS:1 n=1 Tax=Paraglomus occultum TaxID=144539 RepID=A0A9N8Z5Y7_9GLOM|nr:6978_t:CDS:1 [Paraglomus occultum]
MGGPIKEEALIHFSLSGEIDPEEVVSESSDSLCLLREFNEMEIRQIKKALGIEEEKGIIGVIGSALSLVDNAVHEVAGVANNAVGEASKVAMAAVKTNTVVGIATELAVKAKDAYYGEGEEEQMTNQIEYHPYNK